jgi:hypothetical protein
VTTGFCAAALARRKQSVHTRFMAVRIIIESKGRRLEAELSDAPAAQKVAGALPFEARMSRWGDEYYGGVDVDVSLDATARELMSVGEIAYWLPGRALCIFFGPTPASTDEKPRAASAVIPVGRVVAGVDGLKNLGTSVQMSFRKA